MKYNVNGTTAMATITIRLDDETEARVKRRPERSGETLSAFVRTALINQLAASPSNHETPFDAWTRLGQDCTGSGETVRSATDRQRIKDRLGAKHRR